MKSSLSRKKLLKGQEKVKVGMPLRKKKEKRAPSVNALFSGLPLRGSGSNYFGRGEGEQHREVTLREDIGEEKSRRSSMPQNGRPSKRGRTVHSARDPSIA